ncbi:MAG TPA: endonuclease III [Sphaerochaeta sp.]|nr:endonuclease III [Sphaerochaeta sp.]
MDEHYWEDLFTRFKTAIEDKSRTLPSVSIIAATHSDPYSVLISTLISLRTKDAVTLEASERLLALAKTPLEMLALTAEEIEEAIYPAGFYRTKARNILAISEILLAEYDGAVPATQQQLMDLPGVGVKTANLTLNLGFGIDAICVDCHVHQIANRLGWIETASPEESEKALMEVMPQRFWIPLNELLVRFGQLICRPVSPFCSKCPETERCPKVGVTRSR